MSLKTHIPNSIGHFCQNVPISNDFSPNLGHFFTLFRCSTILEILDGKQPKFRTF